jgi:chorismate mutase / prephenate dehydratase
MPVTHAPAAIACLGPDGSFSQLVARLHFPGQAVNPLAGIPDVFDFLRATPGSVGVVPIENSSGGMINQTVDGLIANAGSLFISEELCLDVKLALLGHAGRTPAVVYSHPVPLQHCERWLKARYPNARHTPLASTSTAAQTASSDPDAAAIGPHGNSALYQLDVLEFPIQADVPNLTHFYVVSSAPSEVPGTRSGLVAALANEAGSLFRFLKPFHDHSVNLTRIQSRPIIGRPNSHLFFVEISGDHSHPSVDAALAEARTVSQYIDFLGSFPAGQEYHS